MGGTPTSAGDPAPPRRRGRAFEAVVGTCAIVVSVVSLFVAISANRTQERMLAASVWPSLIFGTSDASTDGAPQISLDLLNRGIGPARVRWAEVAYRGTPVRGSRSLLSACCGQSGPDDALSVFTSGLQRRVIGADEWVTLLRIPRPEATSPVYDTLARERTNIRLRLCYCSVLDECWILDSGDNDDPRPVRQCPAAPDVLWGVADLEPR